MGVVDHGAHRDHVADVHRGHEAHVVHAGGDHAAARVLDRGDPGGGIHQPHDGTAVHIAGVVRVLDLHDDGEHRHRVGDAPRGEVDRLRQALAALAEVHHPLHQASISRAARTSVSTPMGRHASSMSKSALWCGGTGPRSG